MEQDKRRAELISQYSAADPSKSQAEIAAAVDAYLAQDKQADAPPATTKVGGITPGSGYSADSGQRPRAVESGGQLAKLANTAEYMLDTKYGGFPGAASDALESLWHRGTTYEGLQNARQARRNTLSTAEQIATSLAGNLIPAPGLPSVVPSMGSFGQAITDVAKSPGLKALAMRTLGRAVEGGVQGAATGYVENAGSTSGGVAPAVSGLGLGSLFGLAGPLLGKVIGGTASAMSAGKRKAVEALEDAVRNNPFRKPSAPVQYGATIRDVNAAPESVLSALQGAVDRIPGRVAAKGMLASDAAREAGAMRDAAEHATGVSPDQAMRYSVELDNLNKARTEATAAAVPTMSSTLNVLDKLAGKNTAPNLYDRFKEIQSARDEVADTAFPGVREKLAGIPYKVEEWFARARNSPLLQEAGRAAEKRHAERVGAPPLPTQVVNGKIVTVPDAQYLQDVQAYVTQQAGNNPSAKPLSGSVLAISGAKEHVSPSAVNWLAEMQHPDFKAINDAFKVKSDEIRALGASATGNRFTVDPANLEASMAARQKAREFMLQFGTPEELQKDSQALQEWFRSQIKDNKGYAQQLVAALAEPDSRESALFGMAYGPTAARQVVEHFAVPSISGRETQLGRGLGVFDMPMSAKVLDKNIPNEVAQRPNLSAADRGTAQQAGGAALQARLAEGGNVSPDASGKFTDQFLAQLGLASKSPQDAKIFEDASRSWSGARALREALTGGQVPSTAIDAASLAAKGGRLATPNLGWTGSRIAHAILETFSGKSKDAMAEEIVRIVLAEPGSTASAIKQLQSIRGANVDVAMKAATILGRVGGSAAGNTDNLSNKIVEPYVPKQLSNLPTRLGALATAAVSTATPTAQDTISRPLAASPVDIPRARLMTGAVPGVAETLRPLSPRGLPEVPDGRGLSSLDGLATPRPPVTIEAPRPSVIDRVRDALGVSPLSAAEVGRPNTSAALPGGLVRYTRIGDVPKTFYDDTMDIIRHEEGFVPYVYDDKAKKGTDRRLYMINGRWRQKDGTKPEGTPTIGHGLTDPEIVNRGTITEKESEVLARAHMAKDVAQMVQKGSPISPILASESYNMGVRRMDNKNVFNLLRNGKYEEAADSLATVTTAKGIENPGLKARRLNARQEMLKKSP